MKIKNEAELLSMFCDKSYSNPLRSNPFFNTKCNEVWSTDGYALIRVKSEILVGEYPKGTLQMPKLEHPCEKTIFVDELSKALEAHRKFDKIFKVGDMVECEECGGSGDLIYKYTDRCGNTHERIYDCPFCDGAGEIEYEKAKNVIIEVGSAHFFANRLQTLKQVMDFLDITSVKITNNHRMEASEFVVNDDIRIVIMPMLFDYKNSKCSVRLKLK
jgi:hypothetical protein